MSSLVSLCRLKPLNDLGVLDCCGLHEGLAALETSIIRRYLCAVCEFNEDLNVYVCVCVCVSKRRNLMILPNFCKLIFAQTLIKSVRALEGKKKWVEGFKKGTQKERKKKCWCFSTEVGAET